MKRIAPLHTVSSSYVHTFGQYLPDPEPDMMGKHIIPVCEPMFSGKEVAYVTDALESTWISSSGKYVEKFEHAFSKKISHTKYAVAVNSGTSALHVALSACGISSGDDVIIPAFTMVATANAVRYCGAHPVLVDADKKTWNMDVSQIEKKITKNTRAIMVVHIYGLPVDMDPIIQIAKKYDIWVIEDASEAHGASYKGKQVGSLGDIAGFSLYANKLITTGEGGIVTTDNSKLALRVRLLINNAFSKERHFWHSMIGFGYRMTNLQGAVGVAQIEQFTRLFSKKQHIAKRYLSKLRDIPGIDFQEVSSSVTHSYWMIGFTVDPTRFGTDKNILRKELARKGIETRSFFIPIHMQPVYWKEYMEERYPVSEQLCRDGLYIPSSPTLAPSDTDYISDVICSIHKKYNKRNT